MCNLWGVGLCKRHCKNVKEQTSADKLDFNSLPIHIFCNSDKTTSGLAWDDFLVYFNSSNFCVNYTSGKIPEENFSFQYFTTAQL